IDAHRVHRTEVDHDAVVDGGEPGDAVTAAAYGDRQVVAAGESDRCDHVRGIGAAHHEGGRASVEVAVPGSPSLGVAAVVRRDDLSLNCLAQLLDRRLAEYRCNLLTHGPHFLSPIGV